MKLTLASVFLLVAATTASTPVMRKVAKRGALPSWEHLALLSSYNPYSALLGSSGPSHGLYGDALALASAPNLDLYGLGGGAYFGGGHHFGGGAQYGGGPHYNGLGLLNVAAAAPTGYNPYFQSYRTNQVPYSTGQVNIPAASPTQAAAAPVDHKAINTFAQTPIFSTAAPIKAYAPSPAPSYEAPTKLSLYASPSPLDAAVSSGSKYQFGSYSPSSTPSPLDALASTGSKYQYGSYVSSTPSPLLDVAQSGNKYQQQHHLGMTSALLTSVSTTPAPSVGDTEIKLSATYSAAASPAATTAARYSAGVAASHPYFGIYGTAFPPSYRNQHYSSF